MALLINDIAGHRYGYTPDGKVLIDSVPERYADEWLASAPGADVLMLCSNNPYPKSVKKFLDVHENGIVYAPSYTAFTLKELLGADARIKTAADKKVIKNGDHLINVQLKSISRNGSEFSVSIDEEVYPSMFDSEKKMSGEQFKGKTVVICYESGCDYTETIAEKTAEGIKDGSGLSVVLIDTAAFTDDEIAAAVRGAEAVIFGTPENGDDASTGMWNVINALPADVCQGKPASVFGNYRFAGNGVSNLSERLRQRGMKMLDGGFNVQYAPGKDEMRGIYEYGYAFACTLLNKPNTHRSTLVKCTVCGEIFDASLGACPVCGVGMDKCIPIYEEPVDVKNDTDMVYLVVGGGIAALSAAEAIRKRDTTGKIIMVSAEDRLPFNRPMLSKSFPLIAKNPDAFGVKNEEWFVSNDIDIRLDSTIVSVDEKSRMVLLADGTGVRYDRMIWAAGAECNVPPISGTELNGVVTVRHIKDLLDVRTRIDSAHNVVVIGGGVLGLEIASEIRKMRARVTVIEMAPTIMGRQLDSETSERLIRDTENFGVDIITGANIKAVLGDDQGCASGVQFADDTIIKGDLVILSCGNKANIGPLKAAGIECARAVKVNKFMETSGDCIWAAGDCAELDGVNYQLWAEASEQGKAAGANAAGDRVSVENIPYGTSFEGMNTKIFAIGDVGKGDRSYKTVIYKNEVEDTYRKYWYADKKICGGVLYGDTALIPALTDAVVKGLRYAQYTEI